MKLTDTQMVILTAAAQRDDGSIHPLPKTLKGGAVTKVTQALLRRGLIAEAPGREDWPGRRDPYFAVTAEGVRAINVEPADCPHLADSDAQVADGGREAEPAADIPPKAKKAATGRDSAKGPVKLRAGTKQALVVEMLRRPEGATVDQIKQATGWQRHTVRGAFAGALKKKLGLTVTSDKVEGRGRVYRITAN